METGIWVYGSASLVLFLIGGLILRNRRREYAPYLKRARQRQTADRRRRASAEEEVASPRSLPIWRRSCGTATSTSAATVPLLSDGSGAEEETKVEHGSSVL